MGRAASRADVEVRGATADRRAWAIAAGLVLLVAAVFAQVAGHDFVNYDDPKYVYENPVVREGLTLRGFAWAFSHFEASNWHPLTWLSHMADVSLFGLRPGGHHLVNALLHAVAAVLLFLALRLATGATWRSGLVAALFAIHPTRVESVAWVAERKDVLSTALAALTVLLYVRWARGPSRRRALGVAAAFAAGLLAKPMLVSLPLVLLLLDAWPLGRYPAPLRASLAARLREKLPLFALAAASCAVTFAAQSAGGAVSSLGALPFGTRLANAVLSYGRYLGDLAWPHDLAVIYPHPAWTAAGLRPGDVALSAGALAAVTLLAAWQRRARPWLAVGWCWFLVTLVPVIGIVQVGGQAKADRYLYWPAVGVFLAAAWGAGELARRGAAARAAVVAAASLALLACGFAARAQTARWRDSLTLFRHTVAVTEENALALQNLGTALQARGEHARAAEAYREALRVFPDDFVNWMNLGGCLSTIGDHAGAAGAFSNAARLEPRDLQARMNHAAALLSLGDAAGAIAPLEAALALAPGEVELWRTLGLAYAHAGRPADAERVGAELRRRDPALAAEYLRRVHELRGGAP